MHALSVLEFDRIRQLLGDHCETPVGRAAASELMPSFVPGRVKILLEETEEAVGLLDHVGVSLRGLRDVRPALEYASKGGTCDGESLFWMGEALRVVRETKASILTRRESSPHLVQLADRLIANQTLEQRLQASLDSDGSVRSEASSSLASARSRKANLGQKIVERINSYLQGKTRDLMSDPVVTQRSGRYVIPLKAENKGKIKGIIHDTSATGATVYLEPEDVVRLGNDLREAEAQERAEVEKVLRALSEKVGEVAETLSDGVEALGSLDLILGRARYGFSYKGSVPRYSEGAFIHIISGRHPLLDPAIAVPMSLELGRAQDAILITGPNTGGKTISIKTVGLFAAMAQCGMMVPAGEVRIGCFTQIWADIGDEQSIHQSLSTFSAHIKNIAEALTKLKPGALVLLDEVGAGTDPDEGAALAQAILREMKAKGAKIMASTHYGELKVFASTEPGFINASMEFDRKSLRPTYKLQVGLPGSSHALHIAERYGIPKSVIAEAEKGATKDEKDLARMIQNLEESQRRAQAAQSRADKLASRIESVEKEAEEKLAIAEEARRKFRTTAATELEDILRMIRIEAAEIFEEIKKDPSAKSLDRARQRLKDLDEVGKDFVKEVKPTTPKAPAAPLAALVKGADVVVSGFDQKGVLLEDPKGGKVQVLIGSMKMQVKVDQLQLAKQPSKPKSSSSTRALTLAKAETSTHEIHLRQMRLDEAKDALEKFLDDAVLGRVPYVRIVHGKGEGVLRTMTQEVLRKHTHVTSYNEASAQEGGAGVTIAYLG